MKKPTIKIAVPADRYAKLESLAASVIESMTANAVNFPAPSPPLSSLQAGLSTLTENMENWGQKGNRGSKKDLMNLRNAAIKMRNLLLKEAAYVMSVVDLSASPEEQGTFIATSGFPAKNERSPQGILEAVRNFHHVMTPRLNRGEVLLRWQKPLNVTAMGNVRVYLVFRASGSDKFSESTFLDAATKTTFTDYNPVRGATNTYFIVPFNNAGRGAISEVVIVEVH